MPKKSVELSALQVKALPKKGPGLRAVGGVSGLHLQVTPSGATSWILRATVGDRRRDMGLGGYPDVSLEGARAKAREYREMIARGEDPAHSRRAARSKAAAERAAALTFDQCAERYIRAHEGAWKNSKHAAQWRATLATYVSPVFGSLLVRDIETSHVVQALERDDLWKTKTETASRLRGRIESVLDWAKVRGYRDGENPARWKGHLDKLLPRKSKVAKVVRHAALDWREVGDFMTRLRAAEGIGARALELAVLCASRSGEVRGARWGEFDLDAGVWTIPADRMKAGAEHRVPLSARAVEALRSMMPAEGGVAVDALVFPGVKGKPLSDMTLGAVLKRMKIDVTAHGFRSTFRDWASETTAYPREVCEAALAHTIDNKVEAAYRRGDLFEKRRHLMADWAAYCSKASGKRGEVVALREGVV